MLVSTFPTFRRYRPWTLSTIFLPLLPNCHGLRFRSLSYPSLVLKIVVLGLGQLRVHGQNYLITAKPKDFTVASQRRHSTERGTDPLEFCTLSGPELIRDLSPIERWSSDTEDTSVGLDDCSFISFLLVLDTSLTNRSGVSSEPF